MSLQPSGQTPTSWNLDEIAILYFFIIIFFFCSTNIFIKIILYVYIFYDYINY